MSVSRQVVARSGSVAIALAVAGVAAPVRGADQLWHGNISNSWNNTQNWLFFTPPGTGDAAVFNSEQSPGIPIGRTTVSLDASQTVASMRVNDPINAGGYTFQKSNAALLTVTGATNLTSAVGVVHPLTFNGFSLNTGGLTLNNSVELSMQNSSSVTAGALSMNNSSVLNLNSGTLQLNAGGHFINSGTLNVNGGTLSFAPGGVLGIKSPTSRLNLDSGYGVQNSGSLQVSAGGDIVAASYLDVGNAGSGTLAVDGTGSTLVATNICDWGRNPGSSATLSFQGGGTGTVDDVRVGTLDAQALVQAAGGTLIVNGAYDSGGGTAVRQVLTSVFSTGTLTLNGVATFNNQASLFLSSGTINLNNNANFNAGSTLTQTGGTLNIAAGRTLSVGGGTVTIPGGIGLANGVNVSVTGGGTLTSASYIDFATDSAAARSGSLSVSGTGSTYTINGTFVTDLARYPNNTATASVGAGGAANFNSGLRMAASGGTATLNVQSGGTVTVGSSFQAGGIGSVANVNLLNGVLNFNADASFLTGAKLTQTSGTLNVAAGKSLFIAGGVATVPGGTAFSNGATLSVQAGGSFTSASYLDFGSNISAPATGTLSVSGTGSNYTTNGTTYSDFGRYANNIGSATFAAGGTGTFGGLRLASGGGRAALTVNAGGTVNIANGFIAGGAGSTAEVKLLGGTLNFTTDANFLAGSTFTYSAGTLGLTSGKILKLANGAVANFTSATGSAQPIGTILHVLNGAKFNATSYYDLTTGTLLVDGVNSALVAGTGTTTDWASAAGTIANVTVSNSATAEYKGNLRVGTNGTATVNLDSGSLLSTSDGNLTLGGTATSNVIVNLTGRGTLQGTGVTSQLAVAQGTTINITDGAVISDGALTLSGNARILATAGPPAGSSGISCRTIAMSGTSRIDLADQVLLVTDISPASYANVRDLLRTGYANGAKNGNGIMSSLLAANPALGIGYGNDPAIGFGFITVRVTLAGDADLDRGVSINDFNKLTANFGAGSGKFWIDGDFDYDGGVSINDFNLLAGNFGKSMPTPSEWAPLLAFAAAHNDLVAFEAVTGVPEPSAGAIALAALGLVRRRRPGACER